MILLPSKHSHPDKTVLAVSLEILKRIRKEKIESYDELLKYLKEKEKSLESLFLLAMNFLFLTGLIDYHSKTDSFRYLGK